MNRFKRLDLILGWATFALSALVYILTLEPSVSLWDCGEFIAASYKLQVVHPPGAPFFLMLGRFFTLFAPSPEKVAMMVNLLSGLASAGGAMFTFWITTYLARKIVGPVTDENNGKTIAILGAGLVAAFSLTFMDSYWFSAVEAEVYALSSFFTALTLWAMLKWEENADKPGADRWLVLIAYFIGLAIGTHLLNLLVIPAIAFVYYTRRYKPTTKGYVITFIVGLLILGFIMKGIIPGIPWLMAYFDLFFVNSLGMPYYSGVFFSIALIIGALVYGNWYSIKQQKPLLNMAMLSLTFIILGYSSYAMVVIRSSANPAIDMNNPEDPFNLLSYINREQYGDRPLLYGAYFNSQPASIKEGRMQYTKGFSYKPTGKTKRINDSVEIKVMDTVPEYLEIGTKKDYEFADEDKTLFPRMGDYSKENGDIGYRFWSGAMDVQMEINRLKQSGQRDENTLAQIEELSRQKPSFGENLRYFFVYQEGYMWMRYFMWNFAGRQNDDQGAMNEKSQGNWLSGIAPLDNARLGPQSNLPDNMANNKARNTYYLLPFLIGLLGLFFHFQKQRHDFVSIMTLFLFTGILLIVYMNQPPFEPRERDYASVGSFQTWCIWIGLGVLAIADWLSKRTSYRNAAVAASAVAFFAAPVLMASQNWDDHDRSGRYLGIHFAKNYLESCEKDAVLLCNGDNDTYPLWYAQNVEDYRTDVRIINQSLLPTDWYSSVLLDKVYKSEPLPLTLTKDDLQAGKNEYYSYEAGAGGVDANSFVNLRDFLNSLLGKNGSMSFPPGKFGVKNFIVKVDRRAVISAGVVQDKDTNLIVPEIRFSLPKGSIMKGDLVLLDLLCTNAERGWKRPIYFTSTSGYDFSGLNRYLQCEGLTYRVVPLISEVTNFGMPYRMADDKLYDKLMNKFLWSNMAEKPNFYLDDKAKLVPGNFQNNVMYPLAGLYLAEYQRLQNESSPRDTAGRPLPPPPADVVKAKMDSAAIYKQRAVAVLDRMFKVIPEKVMPLRPEVKIQVANIYAEFGESDKAKKVLKELFATCKQYAVYFKQFGNPDDLAQDLAELRDSYGQVMGQCMALAANKKYSDLEKEFKNEMNKLGGQ